MSWTRFKYERTRLPEHLTLRTKAESQVRATSNNMNQSQARPNPNQDGNIESSSSRRVRPKMTEQMRQLRAKDKEDGIEVDDDDDEMNENKDGKDNTTNNNNTKTKTAKNKSKLPAWALRHSTAALSCPNCRNGGKPLNDPKAGRTVCTECGFVIQIGYISEQSEWRNFADSDKSGPDPNRVGSAGHYLLGDVDDLSTKVGEGYLQNLQNATSSNNASQKLISAIRNFERQGRDLGLTKDTQNCAGEIFKDLLDCEELRSKQSKSKQAISMYLAAKQCGMPRPFKEICRHFDVDNKTVRKLHSEVFRLQASKKLDLGKHRKQNERAQGIYNSIHDKQVSTIEVYAMRYSSKLQLDKKKISKLLKSIVSNVENKFDFSKNRRPTSIAAACVYFACMMIAETEKEKRSYKEIEAVSSIKVNTIQTIYRTQLHPNRTKLIPSFADQLRAQNLPLS